MAENPRIEELRRRVQADPASIAFAALAEEYRRIGRHEDAIKTCRTGLLRHPAYLSARVTLGRALIETGDYDAARVELETVLRSAPENIAARRGLEEIRDRAGESTAMDPAVAALANQPARVAPARAAEPVRADGPVALKQAPVQPASSISRGTPDLPLNPAAAASIAQSAPQSDLRLNARSDLRSAPHPAPGSAPGSDDEAFEIFTAALDQSVVMPEPAVVDVPPAAPPAAMRAPAVVSAPPSEPEPEPAGIAFDAADAIVLDVPAFALPAPAFAASAPALAPSAPTAPASEPTASASEPTASAGEPSASASEPTASAAGEPTASVSELTASVETPDASAPQPDPEAAASVVRLERLLGAIQTARQA